MLNSPESKKAYEDLFGESKLKPKTTMAQEDQVPFPQPTKKFPEDVITTGGIDISDMPLRNLQPTDKARDSHKSSSTTTHKSSSSSDVPKETTPPPSPKDRKESKRTHETLEST